MPHYENVPFEVPDGWCWCKLKDIMEFINGRAYKKEDLLSSGKYKVLRVGNFFTNNSWYYSNLELTEDKYCYKGDLLYAWSASFGPKIWDGDKTIFHYHIWNVKYNNSVVTRDYLFYFLLYDKNQISKSTTGSTMVHVSMENMKPRFIPLPPLKEQQRIVAKIEHWLTLINQIEQGKAELQTSIKQTKSKILDLAIHGKLVPQDPTDEPAFELLKRINPKAEITCDNGQYGKIPKNWCACKLVDICSFLSRGKSPKYSENDKTYPVFAQKCNLKDGGISLEQARFLDPSTINKWNDVYKLQTGDVLVNSTGTGTVGRTRLFNTNCLGSYPFVVPDSHVSVIRVLKSICPQFIYAFISSNSIQQYMEENLAGSTNQKELYIGVLENMLIFLPPLAEQHRIVAKIEELFSSLDNIQKALEV